MSDNGCALFEVKAKALNAVHEGLEDTALVGGHIFPVIPSSMMGLRQMMVAAICGLKILMMLVVEVFVKSMIIGFGVMSM